MSRQLRLDVAQLTDVGRKRPHNEDNMAYVIPKDSQVMARKGALFIVADGMGGHAAGEVASEIAVDTVSNAYYQDDSDDIPLSLMNAIKRANALIHQRAAENMMRSGMGTTCVAAVLRGGIGYIANVGDSRAYLIRNGQAKQISQDHSWVEEQVRAGLLTKDQARSHAQRNVITRCLGTQSDVEVDVFPEPLQEGDTFILCSDGLSGLISEDDLRTIITQYMPSESVYHLVERANANGGPDNITAIVMRVLEPGEDPPGALYPVHAGNTSAAAGAHVADESTAVLGRVASPSLTTIPSPRVAEGQSSSLPAESVSGEPYPTPGSIPISPSSLAAPQKKRRRLLFPTLMISLVLVVLLGMTAGYLFFLRPSHAQAALDQASDHIRAAQGELTTNPSQALHDLSAAQVQLHESQTISLSSGQTGQLQQLQQNLVTTARQALTNYNTQGSIVTVPCASQSPASVSGVDSSAVHVVSTTIVNANKHVLTFALGSDNNLYLLKGSGQSLAATKVNVKTSDKIQLLTGDGQALYLLTVLPAAKQADGSGDYTLHRYSVDQNGNVSETGNTLVHLTQESGLSPKFITVWENNIYIIASSSNQTDMVQVIVYQSDHLNENPRTSSPSIPTSLVGAVAIGKDQLILLHRDGSLTSLAVPSGSKQPVELAVALKGSILTPWSLDSQQLSPTTAIPTPSPDMSQFVRIPAPSTQYPYTYLAAGLVNKVTHVYLADNTNHRVLDFQVNGSSSSTGTAQAKGSSSVSLQLAVQYASSTALPVVQSLALDTSANHLVVMTNTNNMANAREVTIDVSSPTACSSAS